MENYKNCRIVFYSVEIKNSIVKVINLPKFKNQCLDTVLYLNKKDGKNSIICRLRMPTINN